MSIRLAVGPNVTPMIDVRLPPPGDGTVER